MWNWRRTWCEWIFGQLEAYLRLNKEYIQLVQVEGERVVVRSGGQVQGCDYAGCINEVTEVLLWPIPHWFLPGSGGRKAWDPTRYFTKDLLSHGRPSSRGQQEEEKGAVPIPAHLHWFPVGQDRSQKRQSREAGKKQQMLCEGMFTVAHDTHPGASRNA